MLILGPHREGILTQEAWDLVMESAFYIVLCVADSLFFFKLKDSYI